MSMRDEKLSKLRESIIDVMKDAEWMTTNGVYSLLKSSKKIGNDVNLEHIGNNLRILKNQGIVADTKNNTRRLWKLTGLLYDVRPPIRMVIPIPKGVYDKISEMSHFNRVSKSSLIISILQEKL